MEWLIGYTAILARSSDRQGQLTVRSVMAVSRFSIIIATLWERVSVDKIDPSQEELQIFHFVSSSLFHIGHLFHCADDHLFRLSLHRTR